MNDQTPELCLVCECCRQSYQTNDAESVRCAVCCLGCCKPLGQSEWVKGINCPARVAPDTDLIERARAFISRYIGTLPAHSQRAFTAGECEQVAQICAEFAHTVANERLGWVPVSEQLPEGIRGYPVIEWTNLVHGPEGDTPCPRRGWAEFDGSAFRTKFKVTHWLPLPNIPPYKQGETE